MRIVIDMQGAQTESHSNSIGRYSRYFAQAIVRNRGDHEIFLVLNGSHSNTVESIRNIFHGLLPLENICVWFSPDKIIGEDNASALRMNIAELLREAFIASLKPDVIHVLSLFDINAVDLVFSIGRFNSRIPVSIGLCDKIEVSESQKTLEFNAEYAAYCARRAQSVKRAALFLSVSAQACQEVSRSFGIDKNRFAVLSAAVGSEFQPRIFSGEIAQRLYFKLGLSRPFVLCAVHPDEYVHFHLLIDAWSALPLSLRQNHQLLVASEIDRENITSLSILAASKGLSSDELLFTDCSNSEELVQLYNLCKIFVFPSWRNSFVLPILEALACGVPVVRGDASGLSELVGLEEAKFDPFNSNAMSQKIEQALEFEKFRDQLRQYALSHAVNLSWEATAKLAIAEWEALCYRQLDVLPDRCGIKSHGEKPTLAFVSPLPPDRTGIADYSADLLPALSAHYEIELVVSDVRLETSGTMFGRPMRDTTWLRSNFHSIDRVIYQIGNSPFHSHMLALLEEIPGVVVLHDFFLSGLLAWQEQIGGSSGAWTDALYSSHGYGAVRDRYVDAEAAQRIYPVNWHTLQHARGVILHSNYARKLVFDWYGDYPAAKLQNIPLVRNINNILEKLDARRRLGIDESDFLVCSFGFLHGHKLNQRLLDAWLASKLAADKFCRLVFVGENDPGVYGANLLKSIKNSGLGDRILITGFASPELFRIYLAAADLAVQLRTHSRGETSAAVLDCMNNALPVIVNGNGSMAELDPQAVFILPDEFCDSELTVALEAMWSNPHDCETRGGYGQSIIAKFHSPEACANRYAAVIEDFYCDSECNTPALINSIVDNLSSVTDDDDIKQFAALVATNTPLLRPAKRIFLDVTATCSVDLKTGIERVARSIVLALLKSPPAGYRIEPIYLSNAGGIWHHRYARNFTLGLLGGPPNVLSDEPIDAHCGDRIIGLDISGLKIINAEHSGLFSRYRALGIDIRWVVYDLLPLLMPQVFPPGADENHAQWLQVVSKFDGAICISKAVADDLAEWYSKIKPKGRGGRSLEIKWWHLGASIDDSMPSKGMPTNASVLLRQFSSRPSFLMVGTVEPRKGYLQAIDAFSHLWAEGLDFNLVIVGKEGWIGIPDEMRRDIPETVSRIRSHSEYEKRLFWLNGISDEFLDAVYKASAFLVAASYGEGFGLPLIEAARYKLPVVARDIPVFREVMGDAAFYFNASNALELALAIKDFYLNGDFKKITDVRVATWAESVDQLVDRIFEDFPKDC